MRILETNYYRPAMVQASINALNNTIKNGNERTRSLQGPALQSEINRIQAAADELEHRGYYSDSRAAELLTKKTKRDAYNDGRLKFYDAYKKEMMIAGALAIVFLIYKK